MFSARQVSVVVVGAVVVLVLIESHFVLVGSFGSGRHLRFGQQSPWVLSCPTGQYSSSSMQILAVVVEAVLVVLVMASVEPVVLDSSVVELNVDD